MFYIVTALCVVVCTFFVGRFFAAKTRLVEKHIDDAIRRKLSTSPQLLHLREQNGVLRNLLIDMVENEGSVAPVSVKTPAEHDRAARTRVQRRRELFGEAVFVLQHADDGRIPARNLKIEG
jgi:low affinity Fe/Cu permease